MEGGGRKKQTKRRAKHPLLFVFAGAAVLAAAVIFAWSFRQNRVYSVAEITRTLERNDSVCRYEKIGGDLLRYSSDGAALISTDGDVIWNEPFDMSSPVSCASEDTVLVYMPTGTKGLLFGAEGLRASVRTELPILKATVSAGGNAAFLANGSGKTEFSYFDSAGRQIASGRFAESSYGFPVDVAVSPDGKRAAAVFISVAEGVPEGRAVFFDFSSGSDGTGHESFTVKRPESILADPVFLTNDILLLTDDKGFALYSFGKGEEPLKQTELDGDVASFFRCGGYFGFVFDVSDEKDVRTVRIFDSKGEEKKNFDIDFYYEGISADEDGFAVFGGGDYALFRKDGHLWYRGQIDAGNIRNVIRLGDSRYALVRDQQIDMIRLG